MRCPFCGCENTAVKDTRTSEDGTSIRRRRQCPDCFSRFSTAERVYLRELWVRKKEGRTESFDREKLRSSVKLALHKRPVEDEQIEKVINGIVRQLETSGESEVESDAIGSLVMEALSDLDSVAYVRFASVYKNFREAQDFERFIDTLSEGKENSSIGS